MVKPCLWEAGVKPGEEVVLVERLDHEQAAIMYRAADVLVPSSHYEEFGLPALNTMAAGTPVVVSNRGSFPKVLGDAAWLVEPTAATLADPVRRAISDGPTQAKSSRVATFKRSARAEAYCQAFGEVFTSGDLGVQES